MADAEECNTGLCLGLGVGGYAAAASRRRERHKGNKAAEATVACLDLTLCPKQEAAEASDDEHQLMIRSSLKTTRTTEEEEEEEEEEDEEGNKNWESNDDDDNNNNNNNNNNNSSRKKLRLTKEQSNLLEDSFKLHSTLNSSKKQSLAEQLNLKPRQVEVWFQNRRARTKLKQTVVDCEFWKRYCEYLTDENKRLKKELQSLKAASPPLFIQLQKANKCCPSCQKLTRTAAATATDQGKTTAAVIDVVLKNNNKWRNGFNSAAAK